MFSVTDTIRHMEQMERVIWRPTGSARYTLSKTNRKPKSNRLHVSKRVRRKHRRAA